MNNVLWNVRNWLLSSKPQKKKKYATFITKPWKENGAIHLIMANKIKGNWLAGFCCVGIQSFFKVVWIHERQEFPNEQLCGKCISRITLFGRAWKQDTYSEQFYLLSVIQTEKKKSLKSKHASTLNDALSTLEKPAGRPSEMMHSVRVLKAAAVHLDVDSGSSQLSTAVTERKMLLTTAELLDCSAAHYG